MHDLQYNKNQKTMLIAVGIVVLVSTIVGAAFEASHHYWVFYTAAFVMIHSLIVLIMLFTKRYDDNRRSCKELAKIREREKQDAKQYLEQVISKKYSFRKCKYCNVKVPSIEINCSQCGGVTQLFAVESMARKQIIWGERNKRRLYLTLTIVLVIILVVATIPASFFPLDDERGYMLLYPFLISFVGAPIVFMKYLGYRKNLVDDRRHEVDMRQIIRILEAEYSTIEKHRYRECMSCGANVPGKQVKCQSCGS